MASESSSSQSVLDIPAEIDAWLEEERQLVDQGQLNPDCKSRLYPVPQGPVRGVVLMLHGFTAGPWQFEELGPILAGSGLFGLAVRLVGHGATKQSAKGNVESHLDMPRASEVNRFIAWAERALAAAQSLAARHDVPLYLVGMSAGGAMALDILRNPKAAIRRALLVAPLVQPKQLWLRALVRTIGAMPFGNAIADKWGISWRQAPPRSDGWLRPGHQQFALGNVMALFRYARAVRGAGQEGLRAPVQIIATASDDKVSLPACRKLVREHGNKAGLYVFPAAEQVPHAMLTHWENANDASRQIIFAIARDFLVDGRVHTRP